MARRVAAWTAAGLAVLAAGGCGLRPETAEEAARHYRVRDSNGIADTTDPTGHAFVEPRGDGPNRQ